MLLLLLATSAVKGAVLREKNVFVSHQSLLILNFLIFQDIAWSNGHDPPTFGILSFGLI